MTSTATPLTDPTGKPSDRPNEKVPVRRHWWWHYEAPTLLLAAALYVAWAALLWWHAALPGWALFVAGGFLAQLHFSLQHESIHAMRHLPKWLRHAVVWPPLNLWLPYPFYNRGHSSHHVNFHLTHPQRDNESAYHSAPAWEGYGPVWRWIYMANQTIAFRVETVEGKVKLKAKPL